MLEFVHPAGGSGQDGPDLERFEPGIRLEHLGRDRGHDGRGEARAVDVLVRLRDHVLIVILHGRELPDELGRERRCVVERLVDALVVEKHRGETRVLGLQQQRQEARLLRGDRPGKKRRGEPDTGRHEFRFLQAVDGGAIARLIRGDAESTETIAVVEAAHRQRRGGRSGGNDRMLRSMARVAHRGADENARPGRVLDAFADRIVEIARLVVAADAHVDDADIVLRTVLEDPVEAATDVVVVHASRGAALNQHHVGLGGNASIQAPGERAVAAGHDGGHQSMPARVPWIVDVGAMRIRPGHIHVLTDAVARRHQVGMGEKAGVEERHGHAPAAEAGRGAEPQPRGKNRRTRSVRHAGGAEMREGTAEAPGAGCTAAGVFLEPGEVDPHQGRDFRRGIDGGARGQADGTQLGHARAGSLRVFQGVRARLYQCDSRAGRRAPTSRIDEASAWPAVRPVSVAAV